MRDKTQIQRDALERVRKHQRLKRTEDFVYTHHVKCNVTVRTSSHKRSYMISHVTHFFCVTRKFLETYLPHYLQER